MRSSSVVLGNAERNFLAPSVSTGLFSAGGILPLSISNFMIFYVYRCVAKFIQLICAYDKNVVQKLLKKPFDKVGENLHGTFVWYVTAVTKNRTISILLC